MKSSKIAGFALLMAVVAAGFAAAVSAQPVDIELVEGYAVSYQVQPTASVVEFLTAHGIEAGLIEAAAVDPEAARTLGAAVDALSRIVDEDEVDWGAALNLEVNKALYSAFYGTDPVYMDLGTTRWVLYPTAEEE